MTGDIGRLAPAARAELIYRSARAGLEDRLWQIAIGRADAGVETAAEPASPRLLDLSKLVDALAADDRFAPQLTPGPVPSPTNTGPLNLGANATFAPAIEAAAARTGLAPAMLAAIVDAEAGRAADGRWDPGSRNPRSTATGLGQFLQSTWLGEARREGSWLHAVATERGWLGPSGAIRPEAQAALLALRTDPAASINAVADHAAANLARLRSAGIRTDDLASTAKAAYLAHHLGLGDAMRYLGRGLDDARAGRLLAAQVGSAAAARRIEAAASASQAHRNWLETYVARRIQPARFQTA
ncbi:hypothetical protein GCM10022281_12400 [Sphingomonas rosea]|uniref:Peptidoglycan-binding protein n=1 Tax=Sphingomonas rosea TaxID=335605 RepID=A0ABP7U085_9SPHN